MVGGRRRVWVPVPTFVKGLWEHGATLPEKQPNAIEIIWGALGLLAAMFLLCVQPSGLFGSFEANAWFHDVHPGFVMSP